MTVQDDKKGIAWTAVGQYCYDRIRITCDDKTVMIDIWDDRIEMTNWDCNGIPEGFFFLKK